MLHDEQPNETKLIIGIFKIIPQQSTIGGRPKPIAPIQATSGDRGTPETYACAGEHVRRNMCHRPHNGQPREATPSPHTSAGQPTSVMVARRKRMTHTGQERRSAPAGAENIYPAPRIRMPAPYMPDPEGHSRPEATA